MAGSITNVQVNFGGAGYALGDTGFILGGDGTAAYTVTDVIGFGHAVAVFSPYPRGNGYSTAFEVGTTRGGAQPGVGSGFIVDILAVACCDATHGPLLAIHISSLGVGYAPSDVITVVQGGNTTGTFRILFSGGGDPIGLEVITAGDCYSAGSALSTTGGSGIGLTVNITAIKPCGVANPNPNRFYSTP